MIDMPGRPGIAIVFPNLKGNVGDFAILDAILRDVARHRPDHARDVYLPAGRVIDEARLAAFRAADTPAFDIVGGTYQAPKGRGLLDLLGLRRHAQARAIRRLAADSLADAERFRAYDAIFVAGGAQWGGRLLGRSMFGTLEAIASVNPAIRAYPFSLNPRVLKNNTPRALKRMLGSIASPLPVRDSISHALVTGIGLEAVYVHDCVFSLAPQARTVMPMEDRNPDRIIFAATGDAVLLHRAVAALVPDVEVELLTTCPPEDEDAYRAIAAEFSIPYRAPLTWQETVAEFGTARAVVTNRLHGLILGSLADAVVVPIMDRKKSEAFALDTGTPVVIDSLDRVSPADVRAGLDQADAIRAAMSGYRDTAIETVSRMRF